MTPERYKQIEDLYHMALAQPSSQRAAFLLEAYEGNDALRREQARDF